MQRQVTRQVLAVDTDAESAQLMLTLANSANRSARSSSCKHLLRGCIISLLLVLFAGFYVLSTTFVIEQQNELTQSQRQQAKLSMPRTSSEIVDDATSTSSSLLVSAATLRCVDYVNTGNLPNSALPPTTCRGPCPTWYWATFNGNGSKHKSNISGMSTAVTVTDAEQSRRREFSSVINLRTAADDLSTPQNRARMCCHPRNKQPHTAPFSSEIDAPRFACTADDFFLCVCTYDLPECKVSACRYLALLEAQRLEEGAPLISMQGHDLDFSPSVASVLPAGGSGSVAVGSDIEFDVRLAVRSQSSLFSLSPASQPFGRCGGDLIVARLIGPEVVLANCEHDNVTEIDNGNRYICRATQLTLPGRYDIVVTLAWIANTQYDRVPISAMQRISVIPDKIVVSSHYDKASDYAVDMDSQTDSCANINRIVGRWMRIEPVCNASSVPLASALAMLARGNDAAFLTFASFPSCHSDVWVAKTRSLVRHFVGYAFVPSNCRFVGESIRHYSVAQPLNILSLGDSHGDRMAAALEAVIVGNYSIGGGAMGALPLTPAWPKVSATERLAYIGRHRIGGWCNSSKRVADALAIEDSLKGRDVVIVSWGHWGLAYSWNLDGAIFELDFLMQALLRESAKRQQQGQTKLIVVWRTVDVFPLSRDKPDRAGRTWAKVGLLNAWLRRRFRSVPRGWKLLDNEEMERAVADAPWEGENGHHLAPFVYLTSAQHALLLAMSSR